MKKKKVFAVAVIAGTACLAGCGRPTTGAEIDRIMAEARAQAAQELAKSRGAWEGQAADTASFENVALNDPAAAATTAESTP